MFDNLFNCKTCSTLIIESTLIKTCYGVLPLPTAWSFGPGYIKDIAVCIDFQILIPKSNPGFYFFHTL